MSSSIYFLVLCIGLISAAFQPEREFEVKQASLLNNGRSYTITEVGPLAANVNANRFTIENELFSIGKKLVLLENGKPKYELKHKIGHLYQKWIVYDPQTGDEVATLKHRPSIVHDSYKVKSPKFGTFRVTGNIGSRTFEIKKDGHQVAEIHKKHFHLRDTYSVKIEAKQDPAIILLTTIGVDEIRHH